MSPDVSLMSNSESIEDLRVDIKDIHFTYDVHRNMDYHFYFGEKIKRAQLPASAFWKRAKVVKTQVANNYL